MSRVATELCPPLSKQIFPLHCVPAYPADAMEDEERQRKLAAGKAKVGARRPRAASGGGDPGRRLGERPGRGAGAAAGARGLRLGLKSRPLLLLLET